MQPTVLITGGAGYIGSWLCRVMLESGWLVRGLDSLKFGGDSLVEISMHPNFDFVRGDLRDPVVTRQALENIQAVVHLAAIVGDPACKNFPAEAEEVNRQASEQLYQLAADAGIKHFVFASTCSNYGLMEDGQLLNEDAPLQPQSLYARLKVGFEEYLLSQKTGPAVTLLRFATAYGFSPRLRFDLTVNHFTRDFSLGQGVQVFGKDLWRPYAHAYDLARAVGTVLGYGPEAMQGKVFNVGDSEENYTKEMIVDEVRHWVPGLKVSYQEGTGGDNRNYKVDFSRIRHELNFKLIRTVPGGVEEIHKLMTSGLVTEPFAARYGNS
ncbi:MAG: NAD(P)-dependent oxidoreductase [Bacteroidia bacterium]|nr:NAD(P)-dependent oxidoreductase [Bacteroidia bacterium]